MASVLLIVSLFFWSGITYAQNQVSPDGNSFITYKDVGGQTDLFIQPFSSVGYFVTTDLYNDYNPQWVDNNTIIFYRKHLHNYQADILMRDLDTDQESWLTRSDYYDSDPAFNGNSKVAFTSNRDGDFEVFVMDITGKNEKQVTFNSANDWSPDWYEDRIVFVSDVHGNFELYEWNMIDQKRRKLTSLGGENYKPDWSVDGSWIAFFHRNDAHSKFDMMILDTENMEVQNITQTIESDEYTCGWYEEEVYFYTPNGIGAYNPLTGNTTIVWKE